MYENCYFENFDYKYVFTNSGNVERKVRFSHCSYLVAATDCPIFSIKLFSYTQLNRSHGTYNILIKYI